MEESYRSEVGHLDFARRRQAVHSKYLVVVIGSFDTIHDLLELSEKGSDLFVGRLWKRGTGLNLI